MDDKKLIYPEQDAARSDEETRAALRNNDAGSANVPAERGRENRGHKPGMTKAGEVVGSGAGAGGGGGPEDFDSDAVAGGGKIELSAPHEPERGHENSNS